MAQVIYHVGMPAPPWSSTPEVNAWYGANQELEGQLASIQWQAAATGHSTRVSEEICIQEVVPIRFCVVHHASVAGHQYPAHRPSHALFALHMKDRRTLVVALEEQKDW